MPNWVVWIAAPLHDRAADAKILLWVGLDRWGEVWVAAKLHGIMRRGGVGFGSSELGCCFHAGHLLVVRGRSTDLLSVILTVSHFSGQSFGITILGALLSVEAPDLVTGNALLLLYGKYLRTNHTKPCPTLTCYLYTNIRSRSRMNVACTFLIRCILVSLYTTNHQQQQAHASCTSFIRLDQADHPRCLPIYP
jgi:hypothetical protein